MKLRLLLLGLIIVGITLPAHAVLIYKKMPDFNQTSKKYGPLPGKGYNYCGPVAASNALMWLASKGYTKLLPEKKLSTKSQYEMIKILGSSKYMNTSASRGTGVQSTVNGLKKYIHEKGYKVSIKKKGLGYELGGEPPSPNWIANGLLGSSNVLVNLGWYEYDSKKDIYKRVSGHFVTVAGVKENKLIIHDPASRGKSKNDFITFEQIKSGSFTRGKRKAKGHWKMRGIKSSNKIAIIDGAFRFKVYK